MHQHSTERTKELKRRRQRRKECLKEKRVTVAAVRASWPIVQFTDYSREFVSYISNELQNGKSPTIWFNVPEKFRTEIINKADFLIAHHSFAAPGEWDGNLKSALKLMREGKIPSGFRNFIDSYRNKKRVLTGIEKYLKQQQKEDFSEED